MIKTTIKQSIWTILMFFSFPISIFLFSTGKIDYITLIAGLGGIITTYLSIIRLTIENDKIFRELFIGFNKRYNEDINDLFNRLRYKKNKQITRKEQLQIIDYLNLCSEEYLWYRKGRVSKNIWTA